MNNNLLISRRNLLQAGVLMLSGPIAGTLSLHSQPRFGSNPFALGVASGDPWPDSVVLWTRLIHAEDDDLRAPIPVTWRVAHDERMTQIVRRGTVTALP